MSLNVRLTPSPALESTTRLEYANGAGLPAMTTGGTAQVGVGSTTVNYSRQRRSQSSSPESSMTWTNSLSGGRATGANPDLGHRSRQHSQSKHRHVIPGAVLRHPSRIQKYNFPQSRSDFPVFSDRRFNVSSSCWPESGTSRISLAPLAAWSANEGLILSGGSTRLRPLTYTSASKGTSGQQARPVLRD